jgi:hypothetical protein
MGESGDGVERGPQVTSKESGARDAFVNEIHDVLGGGSGKEDFGDAGLLEGGDVGLRDNAPDENGDVGHAFFMKELHELRADGVVGAGEDGKADDVDVFLDGGGGDHLGSLPQAGVDDFHAGIAEGAGDYFCAAVMTIKTRLGNQHTNLLWRHKRISLCHESRKATTVSLTDCNGRSVQQA